MVPLRLNIRPLYLHYWIPFALLGGFIVIKGIPSLAKIGGGDSAWWGTAILYLAWALATVAFVDTAIHLGLPRLKATKTRLNLARRWLVEPKLKADFEWLVNNLQKGTKGTEGVRVGALLEHLELADYNRQLVNWETDPGLYREFVLSPVIELSTVNHAAFTEMNLRRPYEMPLRELDWRRPLWENFYLRIRHESDPYSAAQIVVRFLRERVSVVPEQTDHGIRTIWETERTDAVGFETIYVAALRSVGIPARLDSGGTAEFFVNGKWAIRAATDYCVV